jgi:hypothetical protein
VNAIQRILTMSYEQFLGQTNGEKQALLNACIVEMAMQSPRISLDKAKRWNKMVPLLQDCIDKGLFREAYTRISILVAVP